MNKTTYLRELSIERKQYGPDEGKFFAAVRFGSDTASISLKLSPEISEKILALSVEAICDATDEASREFKEQLMKTASLVAPKLPHPAKTIDTY